MGNHSIKRAAPHRGRRSVAIVGVAALAVAVISGVAGVSSSTSEGIVTITPHNLTTGATIAAGKSVVYVVSGASTTVPTDATRVQLSVAVSKQQQPGTLNSTPYLDVADASGDALTWATPNTAVSGTYLEAVGVANKVAFTNSSAGSVFVVIKITGYSTAARLAARLDNDEKRITALESGRRGWVSSGAILTAGDNYIIVAGPFTPSSTMTCMVTSSVQISMGVAAPAGSGAFIYVRNAIQVNDGAQSNDGAFGHYVIATGQPGYQSDTTRTSTFTVVSGNSYKFGAFIGSVPGAPWVGGTAEVSTAYDCR